MNDNVVYIDYLDSYLDIANNKIPKIIRKIIYKFCNYLGIVKTHKNYLKICCVEKDFINEKMIYKLLSKIKELNLKDVVLADNLLNNLQFKNILKEAELNILDGRWLYKFIVSDIVEKISYVQNINMRELEISILMNDDSDISIENIKVLAQKCKIVNIITERIDKFEIIEKYLFDEYGIIINVSSNKKKACIRSDIILNFDFTNEKLEVCEFREKNVLVQVNKRNYNNKNGITIIFYKLKIPIKYFKNFKYMSHFNEEILYESSLYYKSSFENVRKILYKDNIIIKYFLGNTEKIDFREIQKNCLKKKFTQKY